MFVETMLIAAKQVAILYVLVAVGFAADKLGIYTRKAALLCTDLLFYVVTPCKIIQSFLSMEYSAGTARNLFIAAGCGFLMHTLGVVISTCVFRKSPPQRASIFKYASVYGNCGYMALPLANAILGAQGVFYCSAVIMTFQIFAFSHGVWLMRRGEDGKSEKPNITKLLLNPGIISVLVGLPLFLLSVQLPQIIAEPVNYIASLNTPLAMLIFGTYMANTKLGDMFREWRIACVALIKLVVMPLLMLAIMRLFGINGALMTALTVSASAPPANNTVMFAAKYGKDTGLASQTVSAVSVLSIFTMPLMLGLSTMF